MHDVIGWDIGGVNTKVARVSGGEILAVRGRPYELQRNPAALAPTPSAPLSRCPTWPATPTIRRSTQ